MLFLFWVIHFPPAKYEKAILYPETHKIDMKWLKKKAMKEQSNLNKKRQRSLPDRHVLVDEVNLSEHDFPWQHREGEGACAQTDSINMFNAQNNVTNYKNKTSQ